MSAVLVARYRDVTRDINCFCPTNKHFCGILWGIPLGHTPPNAKETHSGCLMLRLNRKINWFDLVMHDSPRMAIWWRGDSRFDYGLLSRSCSFQKAKAWCFRAYKQRIAKRYMWHHVPRCPHAFSTCHFIEWKLVLCNILHHLQQQNSIQLGQEYIINIIKSYKIIQDQPLISSAHMLYSWLISSIHMLSDPVFSESTDFPGLSFRFVASRWTCQHPDGSSDGFRLGFSVCWFLMLGFLFWTISNKLERPKKEHIFRRSPSTTHV